MLLTPDTAVYRDDTAVPGHDLEGLLPRDADISLDGDVTVQQVVTLVNSQDEMGENTEIQVWGADTDIGVVADILVYRAVTGG